MLRVAVATRKLIFCADFMLMTAVDFGAEYFGIIVGYNAMLERICRGNYLKYSEQKEAENGAKNEFSCCYSNTQPVSYTHLDVYKRQVIAVCELLLVVVALIDLVGRRDE